MVWGREVGTGLAMSSEARIDSSEEKHNTGGETQKLGTQI